MTSGDDVEVSDAAPWAKGNKEAMSGQRIRTLEKYPHVLRADFVDGVDLFDGLSRVWGGFDVDDWVEEGCCWEKAEGHVR